MYSYSEQKNQNTPVSEVEIIEMLYIMLYLCKAKAQVGSTPHKKQPKGNHYLEADSADTPAP